MKKILSLLSGETIDLEAHPSFSAFLDLYFIWVIPSFAAGCGLFFNEKILALLKGLRIDVLNTYLVKPDAVTYIFLIISLVIVIILSVIVAYKKINSAWLFGFVSIFIVDFLLLLFLNIPSMLVYVVPFIITGMGLINIEFYRRSHKFYITNKRLHFSRIFFAFNNIETDMYFKHINSIVSLQTGFEKIFNCATIIPISSSGMNLGSEIVKIKAGLVFMTYGTGKEKKVPRAIPYLSFFSIREHEKAVRLLNERLV